MKHAPVLAVFLVAVWFLWSGHTDTLLVSLGLCSCALVVALVMRMGTVDDEGVPFASLPRLLIYLPWLGWQIVGSNLHVARRVLSPGMPIAPRMIRVRSGQQSEAGQVLLANSITLTPGTVSVRLHPGEIEVHALTAEAAAELADGEMDRRVTRVAGGR